jgi:hypothetical protein
LCKCSANCEIFLTLPRRRIFGALTLAAFRQRFGVMGDRLLARLPILRLADLYARSCSFSSFLICAFRLDKHSDAKRFFGPMSRTSERRSNRFTEICFAPREQRRW